MPSALNVDNEGCFQSLTTIEALQAKVVLPGHGDPLRESAPPPPWTAARQVVSAS